MLVVVLVLVGLLGTFAAGRWIERRAAAATAAEREAAIVRREADLTVEAEREVRAIEAERDRAVGQPVLRGADALRFIERIERGP